MIFHESQSEYRRLGHYSFDFTEIYNGFVAGVDFHLTEAEKLV